jgi:hypothetical protein
MAGWDEEPVMRLAAASRTAIAGLRLRSRPAAVAGFVVPIVVDTVERHSGGALAHIGEEVFEVAPPFAERDASSAIPLELSCFRVGAALPHVDPRGVGSVGVASGAAPVLGDLGGEPLTPNAPATGGIAAPQVATLNGCCAPARARAQPICVARHVRMREAQRNQLAEALTGNVGVLRHVSVITQEAGLG